MNNTDNIILTGFMGTGKSTIGSILAKKIDYSFADIDSIIEARMQQSINSIFSTYGEQYFRTLEKEIIKEYENQKKYVISTGGGAIIDSENRKRLSSMGIVILLKARPEIILRNIGNDNGRPLLKHENPMARIIELLEERQEFYSENHFEIDVSDLTVNEVIEEVLNIINS